MVNGWCLQYRSPCLHRFQFMDRLTPIIEMLRAALVLQALEACLLVCTITPLAAQPHARDPARVRRIKPTHGAQIFALGLQKMREHTRSYVVKTRRNSFACQVSRTVDGRTDLSERQKTIRNLRGLVPEGSQYRGNSRHTPLPCPQRHQPSIGPRCGCASFLLRRPFFASFSNHLLTGKGNYINERWASKLLICES